MSPFEALYGIKPRQICHPNSNRSSVATVEDFQVKREAMNHILHEAIQIAQSKYKHYADRNRREVELQVGDWVFLKLQPYKKLSVAVRKYLKLSHWYYGPYKVLQRIGTVAYTLELPPGSLIHPVFHVSLLKKKIGSKYAPSTTLPRLGAKGQFIVYPVKILSRRSIKRGNVAVVQWLVQWSHSIPEDASWEDAAVIMDQYPDFNP